MLYTKYTQLASQIINDVYSGLQGLHENISLSIDQLEDEIVNTRLQIIKEYQLKGIIPIRDLVYQINCIPVDCHDLERCPICHHGDKTPNMHFEIPQIVMELGEDAIMYLGSVDRTNSFTFYYSPNYTNTIQKYRRRGKDIPYVYIDPAPNENNMLDCYVFNAPFLDMVSIVAVFKDPRQLENYGCCAHLDELNNMNFIDVEIKERLTKLKLQYYRQYATGVKPNDQRHT